MSLSNLIKDVYTYDKFVESLVSDLSRFLSIHPRIAKDIVMSDEHSIKYVYETMHLNEYNNILMQIVLYAKEEFVPKHMTMVPYSHAKIIGINIRHPRPVLLPWRGFGEPPLSYIYPRFVEWAIENRKSGYSVFIDELVPVRYGMTHVIVSPEFPVEKTVVYLYNNSIAFANCDIIAYMLDIDNMQLYLCKYSKPRIIVE